MSFRLSLRARLSRTVFQMTLGERHDTACLTGDYSGSLAPPAVAFLPAPAVAAVLARIATVFLARIATVFLAFRAPAFALGGLGLAVAAGLAGLAAASALALASLAAASALALAGLAAASAPAVPLLEEHAASAGEVVDAVEAGFLERARGSSVEVVEEAGVARRGRARAEDDDEEGE